jgi:hypothetical protein
VVSDDKKDRETHDVLARRRQLKRDEWNSGFTLKGNEDNSLNRLFNSLSSLTLQQPSDMKIADALSHLAFNDGYITGLVVSPALQSQLLEVL